MEYQAMYKFDVATNIRNIDWEVFGKNDVFFVFFVFMF